MRHTPSKKIVMTGVISVVVLTGLFVFIQRTQPSGDARLAQGGTTANLTPYTPHPDSLTERDSDGDGLKDWEEVLWKTDPHNKDTDGDGTSDYDEVMAGRDPTKPGPDDKLKTPDNSTATASSSSENLTATEKLGREFFAAYMQARQSGTPVTKDSMQGDIQSLVTNAAGLEKIKHYDSADIHTSTASDTAAIKEYANTIGDIVIRYTPVNHIEEFSVFASAVQSKNYADLEKLNPTIVLYTHVIQTSLAVQVPQSIASLHLHLLNAMSDYKETLVAMHGAQNDPVLALVAMGNYKNRLVALFTSIQDIGKYFQKEHIPFGTKEGGHVFLDVL